MKTLPLFENEVNFAFSSPSPQGSGICHIECLHRNLKRLCGLDQDVTKMSLTSIPPLLDRLPLDFRPGQFHEANDPISCPSRKIPTLESVFQAFPDTDINIDIKDHDPELAKQVLPLFENTT